MVCVALVVVMTGSVGCGRDALGVSSDAAEGGALKADPPGPPQVMDSLTVIDGPGWVSIDSLRIEDREEEPHEERPNPESLMAELAAIYRGRDLDQLEGLLSSDFRFYPAQIPDGSFPSPPELYWNKETEMDVHRNLFDPEHLGVPETLRTRSISAQFICKDMRQAAPPSDNVWILDCRGDWQLWNPDAKPKPTGYRHVSDFTLVVAPRAQGSSEWIIKLWRERPGVGWLLYTPAK